MLKDSGQSFPDDTIWALPKLKSLADNNFIEDLMAQFLFERIENIVGTGENAGNQHFLLFPLCFQKAFLGSIKIVIV